MASKHAQVLSLLARREGRETTVGVHAHPTGCEKESTDNTESCLGCEPQHSHTLPVTAEVVPAHQNPAWQYLN